MSILLIIFFLDPTKFYEKALKSQIIQFYSKSEIHKKIKKFLDFFIEFWIIFMLGQND